MGKLFTTFLPAISTKAKTAIIAEVRDWHIHRRGHLELDDLARMFNVKIRGWINYHGRYYPTALWRTFQGLNRRPLGDRVGRLRRRRLRGAANAAQKQTGQHRASASRHECYSIFFT